MASGDFVVNYSVGGNLDSIGQIKGFPKFTQPYNTMLTMDIPAIDRPYELIYETPDQSMEILLLSVTCTGYHEKDRFNIYCNDNIWFKNWATSEMKEGLFLGPNAYVYQAPPKTQIRLVFNNYSHTSKIIFFGIRMLCDGIKEV